jgi:N-acetyl-gamma-glutamyl-phosphate reductase
MMHNHEASSPSVLLVGARGYAGQELARLLLAHPSARLEFCLKSDDAAFRLDDYVSAPGADAVETLAPGQLDAHAGRFQVAFLATPAEVSVELAPRLLAQGCKVIDLSGAFRLAPEQASSVYGVRSALLSEAEYGLVPFAKGKPARLIANPGCYATSILLALIPLLRAGLIEPETLVIDAKSGATGAGRKAAERLLFSEVDGECTPYKVAGHPHHPEIVRFAGQFAETVIDPTFTPHLLPIRRGLLSNLYARTRPGVTGARIAEAYAEAYSHYPLVRFGAFAEGGLSWRRIEKSPDCEIRYSLERGKLSVFSLIDNLMKGAASQALENFNRLLGIPPETGLPSSLGEIKISKEGIS